MSVEVKLELGHKAAMKDKPTPEGFTHDWTVFVRGCEGSNIHHFVDKVVFQLHESFPKPKRVVKEPPYQVSESGYAGFIMPIEVYFRNKEEPKKVRFEYDLFLRLEGSPVHNIRLEKLTFQNPSDDFRRKLLKARSERATSATGGGVSLPTAAIAPIQHTEEPRPPPHLKTPAVAEKRPKSHSSAKEPSKPAVQPPTKPASQPFENIFGSPIKAKSSPDQATKSKDSIASAHPKTPKTLQPPAPSICAPVKELKAKEPEAKESKQPKPPKSEKEQKIGAAKRPLTPEVPNHSNASSSATPEKKRKHVSSGGKKAPDSAVKSDKTKDKKEKTKSKSSASSSLSGKKEKHKGGGGSTSHGGSNSKSSANSISKLSPPDVFAQSQNTDSNSAKPFLKSEDSSSNTTPHSSAPVLSPVDSKLRSLSPPAREADDFSTFSSDEEDAGVGNVPPPQRSKDKLNSSSSGSNHHSDVENGNSNHAFPDRPPSSQSSSGRAPSAKSSRKSPNKTLKNNNNNSNSSKQSNGGSSPALASVMRENHVSCDSPVPSAAPPPPSECPKSPKQVKTIESSYHQELVELQKSIMAITDQQQLQRIVDVIEKTGKFHITSSSFDFDLCSLDIGTVRQLKSCLSS